MPPFSSHRCRAIEWLPVFKPNTDTYNKQFTCYTRLYRNIERTNTIAIELANPNLSRTSLSLERTGLSIRFRTDEKSHSCCYSVTNMNFVSRLLPSSTRSIDFKDFSRKQRSNWLTNMYQFNKTAQHEPFLIDPVFPLCYSSLNIFLMVSDFYQNRFQIHWFWIDNVTWFEKNIGSRSYPSRALLWSNMEFNGIISE